MYQTILVPLDGSVLAEQALAYAKVLAEKSGAKLALVRVVGLPEFPYPLGSTERERALGDADDYVNSLIAHREGDPSLATSATFGDPAPLIVDEASSRDADLIAMSTHGRSNAEKIVYGSVASYVVRHGNRPVLLVPRGCERVWTAEEPKRLLVPLDGSDRSHGILKPALALADTIGAEVVLLRVVAPTSYIRVEGYEDPVGVPTEGISSGDAETYLNEIVAEYGAGRRPIKTLVVEGARVADAIGYAAREQEASAIAMATHGRGGLASVVMGSVATEVVQHATTPVLLVRPHLPS
jgi:nucleotide-binding universal stress UspA family protein